MDVDVVDVGVTEEVTEVAAATVDVVGREAAVNLTPSTLMTKPPSPPYLESCSSLQFSEKFVGLGVACQVYSFCCRSLLIRYIYSNPLTPSLTPSASLSCFFGIDLA